MTYDRNGTNFAPIESAIEPVAAPPEEDTDYKDLSFFGVRRSLIPPEALIGTRWLDLHRIEDVPNLVQNDRLVVAGYPATLQHIDYEHARIRAQRLIADGIYAGQAESRFCHIVRFNDISMVPEEAGAEPLSGLSGSPVFVTKREGGHVNCRLAGIMLRATKASSSGRFVHSQVIFRALEMIRAGNFRAL